MTESSDIEKFFEIKKFDAFFTGTIEYPIANGLPDVILPYGEQWEYVSSSFINGFINCGDLVGVMLLNRYCEYEEEFDEPETLNLNPPNESMKWEKVEVTTKKQVVELFQAGWRQFHITFKIFEDDVLLLKRIKPGHYLYIWCDCDVSDCLIARFRTTMPEEDVVKLFLAYGPELAQRCGDPQAPIVLDVNWFRGWLSF